MKEQFGVLQLWSNLMKLIRANRWVARTWTNSIEKVVACTSLIKSKFRWSLSILLVGISESLRLYIVWPNQGLLNFQMTLLFRLHFWKSSKGLVVSWKIGINSVLNINVKWFIYLCRQERKLHIYRTKVRRAFRFLRGRIHLSKCSIMVGQIGSPTFWSFNNSFVRC